MSYFSITDLQSSKKSYCQKYAFSELWKSFLKNWYGAKKWWGSLALRFEFSILKLTKISSQNYGGGGGGGILVPTSVM